MRLEEAAFECKMCNLPTQRTIVHPAAQGRSLAPALEAIQSDDKAIFFRRVLGHLNFYSFTNVFCHS